MGRWYVVAAFVSCASSTLLAQAPADAPLPAAAQHSEARAPNPPGRLVDLGGWRMHLNCTGERRDGAPLVILEAGAGDSSAEWSLVQPDASQFTRVCSYDRSGSGWSDLGPAPHTGRQIAFELNALLSAAGEQPPYLLVGHSMGGRYVRIFASRYPEAVAGLVLVDAGHEDNTLFVNGKAQRLWVAATGQPIPEPKLLPPLRLEDLPDEALRQIEAAARQANARTEVQPYNKLPSVAREARRWAWSQPKHFAANNSSFDGDEALEMRKERERTPAPLGNLPLVVVTRGQPIPDQSHEEERLRLQADLVRLSRRGRQVVASNSGHHVHLDEPRVVVDAIRAVFEEALSSRGR